jgi:hypothetical protein
MIIPVSVPAALMARERTRPVCEALAAALARYGVPQQILTDNGKVFTGRFGHPPVEVLFDRICRENGIDHLLTAPRSPTTTGKIERFHRTLRAEFDTGRVFSSLKTARQALDEWVACYNTQRPHQALGMAVPASRFPDSSGGGGGGRGADLTALVPDRSGEDWVARKVGANGVVCVSWQQVSVGKHYAGSAATCMSVPAFCSSGSALTCSRPSPGPAAGRCARRTRQGPNLETTSVKDHPEDNRQGSPEGQQPHRSKVQVRPI